MISRVVHTPQKRRLKLKVDDAVISLGLPFYKVCASGGGVGGGGVPFRDCEAQAC